MQPRDCCATRPVPAAVWRLASVFLLAMALVAAPAAAQVTVNVVDGSDGTTAYTGEYRWVIEKDLMYHVPFDNDGAPITENTMQALSFHRSHMPVVAEGLGSAGVSFTRETGAYYYISVLPMSGYQLGGALIGPDDTSVTVFVNPQEIPTAQIVVQVCEDTNPINNVCDPGENPLEGFEVIVEDGGGRYGMSAGLQSYDIWGNPLGTTYQQDANGNYIYDADGQPTVLAMGSGINTDADGMAYIKNLAPGKYGVIVVPPAGEGWQQTSTIEGKKVIDAWVKANEPPYFAEFGPPGPHVFIGFIRPFNDLGPQTGPNITGQVVNLHMSRPPEFAMYAGGPFPHTNCWVGINDFSGGVPGNGLYAEPCSDNGYFTIPNVPAGSYQLVVWDDNLDLIFLSKNLTVNADGSCNDGNTCNLGKVPARQWFARVENWVFNDVNQDGRRQCATETCMNASEGDEVGIPEQAVNLRWRDGTMYQSAPTDLYGFVPFDETFPFFSWLVAEVDFARFKATGATFYTDNGGEIPFTNNNSWDGNLNPQTQNNPNDPGMWIHDGYGGVAGDARTEAGVVLTQAFQAFLGQTNVIEWGKAPYGAGENGGISGVVYYSVTRAEDDPELGGPEPWEPGIPGVTVNLYDAAGTTKIATTMTDSWDDSQPSNCQIGDSIEFIFDEGGPLQKTIDCYDGIRNWNQQRPGVFDGGYAFDTICSEALNANGDCPGTEISPIPSGRYIVEVETPDGYEIVRSQDKNVDFGDDYIISGQLLPAPCVGAEYTVPQYLSLNDLPLVDPAEKVEANLAGQTLNLCDRKRVGVSGGNNAAADFFLFTQAPIAAHAVGFILDDTANEFDPSSPQFGEKYAPPFLPVSIRDWTGRQIGRTYSDGYGRYNFLAPSTWTQKLPQPSGISPNMLTTCMNDRLLPDGTPDPLHNPQYSQFCYTFQYMPGSTVYLDTPVVPVAAFTGADQFPLDCEFENGTPRIAQATTNDGGPYLAGRPASNSPAPITITSMGNVDVPNPLYEGLTSAVPKNITRDYGFGATAGTVTLNGTPIIINSWSNDVIQAAVPRSAVAANGATYQLQVTRGDNGLSSVNGITLQVGLRNQANLIRVPDTFPTIQEAIDAAGTNDLILVAPGTYNEMVIMWKPVQLQGWGEATIINPVKTPAEKLQAWRLKVASLVTSGQVTLVPGQEAAFGGIEPAALWAEEGTAVLVLASAIGQNRFDFSRNQGARIDGFSMSGADTGGGVTLNGFASDMQVSNNRIINNSGQYAGGIRLGHPTLVAQGAAACGNGVDLCYPDAENNNVTIKNNYVGQNGGINGAGGGVSLCTGSESYQLTDNYICGNFNMDQGGGVAHFGYSAGQNVIARNVIAFNDSFNQGPGTTPAGGGLLIAGQPPVQGAVLSSGTGDVLIDSNLFLGNAAEAGDGGAIRLQEVNGTDVADQPNSSNSWHAVEIVNNMIANNVSALAGGGISMSDAKNVTIRHNTIAHNDSTATAGAAFNTGSPLQSEGQLGAGIASRRHSNALLAAQNTGDADFSDAVLEDNIVWQNRTFRFNGQGTTVDPNLGGSWFGLCPTLGINADPNNCPASEVGDWAGDAPKFSDVAVLGVAGSLTCSSCIVSELGDPDPQFVSSYFNGNRAPTIEQPEQQTIFTPAAFDEGGNFIRLRFGPLTRWDPISGNTFGDYHIQAGSPAVDAAATGDPAYDFDGDARGSGQGNQPDPDIGADEIPDGAGADGGSTNLPFATGVSE